MHPCVCSVHCGPGTSLVRTRCSLRMRLDHSVAVRFGLSLFSSCASGTCQRPCAVQGSHSTACISVTCQALFKSDYRIYFPLLITTAMQHCSILTLYETKQTSVYSSLVLVTCLNWLMQTRKHWLQWRVTLDGNSQSYAMEINKYLII